MTFSVPALAQSVVNLGAVRRNVAALVAAARQAGPAGVMAVVKADAYSHGVGPVAHAALAGGASWLGVATLQELFGLDEELDAASTGTGSVHEEGVPVFSWLWFPEELQALVDAGVWGQWRHVRPALGVASLGHAQALVEAARQVGRRAEVMVMVDTGLSRNGVDEAELDALLEFCAEQQEWLDVLGLCSHLASADEASGRAVTELQRERFVTAIARARSVGLDPRVNHIANSPAVLQHPDLVFDLVRTGVSVYGVDPTEDGVVADGGVLPGGLEPAMMLRARVVTVKRVPAGEGVSYGHAWRAPVDTWTAVVAVGYADGIPRSASGKFVVRIGGEVYEQVGRVCMDQFVVNLGPAGVGEGVVEAPVQPGEWAIVFGGDGPHVDAFAEAAGTIAYEALTNIRGTRVQRLVVDDWSELE